MSSNPSTKNDDKNTFYVHSISSDTVNTSLWSDWIRTMGLGPGSSDGWLLGLTLPVLSQHYRYGACLPSGFRSLKEREVLSPFFRGGNGG